MMDHDRAFSASGSSADPAAIAVASEHLLPQTTKIFLILPLERVARGTHAQRENFPPAATTVKCPLNSDPNLLHFLLPFLLKESFQLLPDDSRAWPTTRSQLACVESTFPSHW